MNGGGPSVEVTRVRHNRIDLAVHLLRRGRPESRALLLLHGLGECTPATVPAVAEWPGDVVGLDFTGHGRSTQAVGGGYTSEVLVGDVDAVLGHLGSEVTVLGRGLGAYVGLLVAAARPDVIRGVVLCDGPGLAGGGIHPGSRALVRPAVTTGPPDPYALMELSRDVRPPDYAQTFARMAVDGSDLDTPLWVSTVVRPAWIDAMLTVPGVGEGTIADGLAIYAPS